VSWSTQRRVRRATSRARGRLIALALIPWLTACGADRGAPCVLLVTIDTLRADAVSAWGVEQDTTPHFDALAASGTRFADATTVTPLTLPAHASMLTGLRPARHGLTVNGVSTSGLPVPTLAEQLRGGGMATAAFVSAAVLGSAHGLTPGFDHYDDDLHHPGGPLRPHERRGDRTVDRALEWIRSENDSGPWFAWVHLFDPHAPYAAPTGASGTDRAAYLDEVRWVDRQLGRLLAGLGDRRVLVVVTSDHGESLGEHGESTHGVLMYQGAMHVPMAIAWSGATDIERPPGFPRPGEVRTDVVSVLDVGPTILDVLGLPGDPDLDGRSLVRPDPGRVLPLECRSPAFYYGFSSLAGVRRGAQKLVGATQAADPGWTLHELSGDPAEEHGQPVVDHALVQRVLSPVPRDEAPVVADLEVLRALGYVGATPPDPRSGPRRDPRDAMDLVDAIDAANTLLVEGQPARAWARLEALPAGYDDVPELRLFRGRVLRALARPIDAARELGAAHVLQPGSASVLVEWGRALLEVGTSTGSETALAEAVTAFQRALELVPGDTEAIAMWSLAEILQEHPDEALRRVDKALEKQPRAVNLLLIRRRALNALGREEEASRVSETLTNRGALPPGPSPPPASPAVR
jgi:choline-sulfatase